MNGTEAEGVEVGRGRMEDSSLSKSENRKETVIYEPQILNCP